MDLTTTTMIVASQQQKKRRSVHFGGNEEWSYEKVYDDKSKLWWSSEKYERNVVEATNEMMEDHEGLLSLIEKLHEACLDDDFTSVPEFLDHVVWVIDTPARGMETLTLPCLSEHIDKMRRGVLQTQERSHADPESNARRLSYKSGKLSKVSSRFARALGLADALIAAELY